MASLSNEVTVSSRLRFLRVKYFVLVKIRSSMLKTISVQLSATPWDCSLPGSTVHGILQARTGVDRLPFSRVSSQPRDWTHVSCISCNGRWILFHCATWEAQLVLLLLLLLSRFSRLTPCDPTDGSPLGSSVPGIHQARILEWVANSLSSAWKWKVKVKSLSRAQLLATPWTAAYQAPPSMGFSRQEYWSGLPLPSPN